MLGLGTPELSLRRLPWELVYLFASLATETQVKHNGLPVEGLGSPAGKRDGKPGSNAEALPRAALSPGVRTSGNQSVGPLGLS